MVRSKCIAVLLAGLFAGCGTADPCVGVMCGASEPPVELTVVDGLGVRVAGARVSATRRDGVVIASSCDPRPSTDAACELGVAPGASATGAGTYDVQVEASGFGPADATVVVPASTGGCCNPGYLTQRVTVALSPL
jgi:hypothetical protein